MMKGNIQMSKIEAHRLIVLLSWWNWRTSQWALSFGWLWTGQLAVSFCWLYPTHRPLNFLSRATKWTQCFVHAMASLSGCLYMVCIPDPPELPTPSRLCVIFGFSKQLIWTPWGEIKGWKQTIWRGSLGLQRFQKPWAVRQGCCMMASLLRFPGSTNSVLC
jgi:hypothetical protein